MNHKKSWYPKKGRVILHADMNSFYASVETADDPRLRGKPLAIAGNPDERKGIIVTCNYEARAYGIKTTMALWQAKKLCKDLIVKRPNMDRYREISREIFAIFEEFTPFVEPISIDEGYLDISECYEQGTPLEIANRIQMKLKEKLDLPCSIGIAPNKFLAKMASDMKKPNGITILRKRDIPNKLWVLPIDDMHGVGYKTAERMRERNIKTIGDLAKADPFLIKGVFGINGEKLRRRALGEDPRPVDPNSVSVYKSIGSSQTFAQDISVLEELTYKLNDLAKKTEQRIIKSGVVGRAVQLTIRYEDRTTITRRISASQYVYEAKDIFYYGRKLLEKHWNERPVRLLGITLQEVIPKEQATYQLEFFDETK
ncbi:DNA polymerase-4 [Gracilibacillus halotolerans]|uniref:DNA polymerase IV n=1 Tax=Gracilibacillus halotolerans TaxID=74386 RepID=A0A841RLY1_9BACI|nr:DNA polymerase IV [Gracilibacillus halotolerans]MBB6511728.1 DNA polymerase-4 [Gracilibacillus halotolerans]